MFKCKTWAHFSGEITVLPDGGDWAFTVYSLGDCLSSPPKTIAMLKLITMIITGQVVIVVVVVVVATVIDIFQLRITLRFVRQRRLTLEFILEGRCQQ